MTGELYLIYTHMSIKVNKSFDTHGLAKKYISLIIRKVRHSRNSTYAREWYCLQNVRYYNAMFFQALFSICLFRQMYPKDFVSSSSYATKNRLATTQIIHLGVESFLYLYPQP